MAQLGPTVVVLFGVAACTTIQPGQAAVITRPSGGVEEAPLTEGTHLVWPGSDVTVFDLRAQTHTEAISAVSADGASIRASASEVTVRPVLEELVSLAREEGPDYAVSLVRPIVQSTVRRLLAGVQAFDLSAQRIAALQVEVTREAAGQLRPHHVLLESVDLRAVTVASRPLYDAVISTQALEQRVRGLHDELELARQRRGAQEQSALGEVDALRSLAPTLGPPVLAESRLRAWAHLLRSLHTRVVIQPASNPATLEVSP